MDSLVVLLKNKLEHTPNLDGAEDFFTIYEKTFCEVQCKAEKNKKAYFCIQDMLISISAVVSILNIFIMLMSTIAGNISYIVPILSSLASLAVVASTFLSNQRDYKKFFETWMRHSTNLFRIKEETSDYLFGIGHYSNLNNQDGFKMFKEKWSQIQRDNYNNFSLNMSTFESNLVDNPEKTEELDT